MLELWDEVGIPYLELDAEEIATRFPWLDTGKYFPPRRIDDPRFADEAVGRLSAIVDEQGGGSSRAGLRASGFARAAGR
jgi:hypothetical protein